MRTYLGEDGTDSIGAQTAIGITLGPLLSSSPQHCHLGSTVSSRPTRDP